VSGDGNWIVMAHAGLVAPVNPGADFVQTGRGAISIQPTSVAFTNDESETPCTPPAGVENVNGQTTAVAFNPSVTPEAQATNTWFAAQTREPATLVLFRDAAGTSPKVVDLGGVSVLDTGHDMFHRDAGGGIACASCHPEGGEDGRVWKFSPTGDRRTQAVHVGLEGTDPFHWDGDMTDFGTLVNEVMVRRMGGPEQSDERKTALRHWLFQLTPPASIVAPDDAQVVRGRTLFESPDVGCSGCHSGAKLTSNQNQYVGTTEQGQTLQVPSLHGVGYRAPFLHDGCAATLRDRFSADCGGGDLHGKTSNLTGADVDDLVAYLQSL
jgi:hypothetical protein